MSSSLLYTILHHLRLCLHSLATLLRTLFHRTRRRQRPLLLAFDNGMQVHVGKQIAEGGFSYVFEAFGPADPAAAASNAKAVAAAVTRGRRALSSSSSSSLGGGIGGGESSVSVWEEEEGGERRAKYALKRIHCADRELIRACRHEAGIHRSLPGDHPNLLTLLGLKFDRLDESSSSSSQERKEYDVCWMLFPFLPHSLRGEIAERNLLWDDFGRGNEYGHAGGTFRTPSPPRRRRPFSTNEILHLLGGIVDALSAMHDLGISHRDVKLENILLDEFPSEDASSFDDDGRDDDDVETARRPSLRRIPVLMDFGSAGPLSVPISSRSDVLTVVDAAAQHTTVSYRPPELFEGGLRHKEEEATLDYGKVDVWSLGCVLFGMMHGSSPFEVEFVRGGKEEEGEEGLVKIVECTQLKVLGEVPFPPWAKNGNGKDIGRNGKRSHESGPEESDQFDGRDGKYPLKLYRFVRYMTDQDRLARPDIRAVAKKLEELYMDLLGERWVSYDSGRGARSGSGTTDGEDFDDGTDAAFDSLLRSRDFV